jgi:hypothetical protein
MRINRGAIVKKIRYAPERSVARLADRHVGSKGHWSRLARREDDTEPELRTRLGAYGTQTRLLLDWYSARGQVVMVDVNGAVVKVATCRPAGEHGEAADDGQPPGPGHGRYFQFASCGGQEGGAANEGPLDGGSPVSWRRAGGPHDCEELGGGRDGAQLTADQEQVSL